MSELKYLVLHRERVAYQDVGDGDTLLLIHGIAGSSATWRAVIPQLSKRYRVVAPDLPGHGKSAKPRGDYSLGAFAVWLRDLLDELGITRVTVVGHSLGGGVPPQWFTNPKPVHDRAAALPTGRDSGGEGIPPGGADQGKRGMLRPGEQPTLSVGPRPRSSATPRHPEDLHAPGSMCRRPRHTAGTQPLLLDLAR